MSLFLLVALLLSLLIFKFFYLQENSSQCLRTQICLSGFWPASEGPVRNASAFSLFFLLMTFLFHLFSDFEVCGVPFTQIHGFPHSCPSSCFVVLLCSVPWCRGCLFQSQPSLLSLGGVTDLSCQVHFNTLRLTCIYLSSSFSFMSYFLPYTFAWKIQCIFWSLQSFPCEGEVLGSSNFFTPLRGCWELQCWLQSKLMGSLVTP